MNELFSALLIWSCSGVLTIIPYNGLLIVPINQIYGILIFKKKIPYLKISRNLISGLKESFNPEINFLEIFSCNTFVNGSTNVVIFVSESVTLFCGNLNADLSSDTLKSFFETNGIPVASARKVDRKRYCP